MVGKTSHRRAQLASARAHAGARRLRRSRPIRILRREWLNAVVLTGLILLFLSARDAVRVRDPPDVGRAAIAVVAPLPHLDDRGFRTDVTLRFRGCDEPLHVNLQSLGSAEYWRDAADYVPNRARVTVAVSDSEISQIVAAAPANLEPGPASAGPVSGFSDGLVTEPVVRRGYLTTAISADVSDWNRALRGFNVSFRADWVHPRGRGSCFVRVPSLIGDEADTVARSVQSVFPLHTREQDVVLRSARFGRRVRESGRQQASLAATARASITIRGDRSFSIISGRGGMGGPASSAGWECRAPRGRASSGDASGGVIEGTFSLPYPSEGVALPLDRRSSRVSESRCGALLTIEEEGARSDRDLLLLAYGAGIGALLSLLAEELVQRRRSRHRFAH